MFTKISAMRSVCFGGILTVLTCVSAQAATYSFATSDEYTSNFRELVGASSIGYDPAGYITNTGVNATTVVAYDTDGTGPGTTLYPVTVGTTLSISAEVTMNEEGSFGFFFGANGGGSTYLALFNIRAANDQFRFFSGGDISTGAAGNESFSNTSSNPMNLGEAAIISASFEALADDWVRISMTANGQTFSNDYTGIILPSQVELAFRSYNPVGSAVGSVIDNLVVTDPIPEPSVTGLVAIGMAGIVTRRRRTK
jgi:hypothetical protein